MVRIFCHTIPLFWKKIKLKNEFFFKKKFLGVFAAIENFKKIKKIADK